MYYWGKLDIFFLQMCRCLRSNCEQNCLKILKKNIRTFPGEFDFYWRKCGIFWRLIRRFSFGTAVYIVEAIELKQATLHLGIIFWRSRWTYLLHYPLRVTLIGIGGRHLSRSLITCIRKREMGRGLGYVFRHFSTCGHDGTPWEINTFLVGQR